MIKLKKSKIKTKINLKVNKKKIIIYKKKIFKLKKQKVS